MTALFSKLMVCLCYALEANSISASLIAVAAIMIVNMNSFLYPSDKFKVPSPKLLNKYLLPFPVLIYQLLREESKFKLQGHRGSGQLKSLSCESKRENSCRLNFRETFLSPLSLSPFTSSSQENIHFFHSYITLEADFLSLLKNSLDYSPSAAS